ATDGDQREDGVEKLEEGTVFGERPLVGGEKLLAEPARGPGSAENATRGAGVGQRVRQCGASLGRSFGYGSVVFLLAAHGGQQREVTSSVDQVPIVVEELAGWSLRALQTPQ